MQRVHHAVLHVRDESDEERLRCWSPPTTPQGTVSRGVVVRPIIGRSSVRQLLSAASVPFLGSDRPASQGLNNACGKMFFKPCARPSPATKESGRKSERLSYLLLV